MMHVETRAALRNYGPVRNIGENAHHESGGALTDQSTSLIQGANLDRLCLLGEKAANYLGKPRRKMRVRAPLKARVPKPFTWNSRSLAFWNSREVVEPVPFYFIQPWLLLCSCTSLPSDVISTIQTFVGRRGRDDTGCELDGDLPYQDYNRVPTAHVPKWLRTVLNGSHGEWTESDDHSQAEKKRASNRKVHAVNPGRGKFGSNTPPVSAKSGVDAGLNQLAGCTGGAAPTPPPSALPPKVAPGLVSPVAASTPKTPKPEGKPKAASAPRARNTAKVAVVTPAVTPCAGVVPSPSPPAPAPSAAAAAPPTPTWSPIGRHQLGVLAHFTKVHAALARAAGAHATPFIGPLNKPSVQPLGSHQLGRLAVFTLQHDALARSKGVGFRPLIGPLKESGEPVLLTKPAPEPDLTPIPGLALAVIPSTRPCGQTFTGMLWNATLRFRRLLGFPLALVGFRSPWLSDLLGLGLKTNLVLDAPQKHAPLGAADDMSRLIGYSTGYTANVCPELEEHIVSSFLGVTSVDIYCRARMRKVATDFFADRYPKVALPDDVLNNTVAHASARIKVIIAHDAAHQGDTHDRVKMKLW